MEDEEEEEEEEAGVSSPLPRFPCPTPLLLLLLLLPILGLPLEEPEMALWVSGAVEGWGGFNTAFKAASNPLFFFTPLNPMGGGGGSREGGSSCSCRSQDQTLGILPPPATSLKAFKRAQGEGAGASVTT